MPDAKTAERFRVGRTKRWHPQVPPWFTVYDSETGAVYGYGYGSDPEKACQDEAGRLNIKAAQMGT
jgi:hypothetical protein